MTDELFGAKTKREKATRPDHLVLILDDDPSVLESLKKLLKVNGFRVRLHADSKEFFQAGLPSVPSCLVLDHQLGNGDTGVQVYDEMGRRGWEIPTVFVTAHWNIQSVVSAMRNGADGFLSKPFDPEELVTEVSRALQCAIDRDQNGDDAAAARKRAASLTPREIEIVNLVVKGLLNKEIADQLGLALVTIKVHRGRAMLKMGVRNSAELGRVAMLAGLCD
jgi:FixJ family two-component response regulator